MQTSPHPEVEKQVSEVQHTPGAFERITRRTAREIEYGVNCYDLQTMLEVDTGWQKHDAEIAYRMESGLWFTKDEADLAITLIHQRIKEQGIDAVRAAIARATGSAA